MALNSNDQVGRLPDKFTTQHADVLARLLSGETLTPIDGLSKCHSFRLAAIAHRLRRDGWPVLSVSDAVVCAGGRIARVARYHMATASAEAARSSPMVVAWLDQVEQARAADGGRI